MNDDFDFDMFDADADEIDAGGGGVVDKPGMYHVEIETAEEDFDAETKDGQPRTPSMRFDMRVLHSTKGQSPKGSRIFHRLYFSDKEGARKGIVKFALRLGLLVKKNGRPVDPATGKSRMGPDVLKRAAGIQAIVEVKHEGDYNGKPQFRIPFNEVFALNDPRVANVPVDKEMALSAPVLRAETLPDPPEARQPTPAEVASDDEFADL